MTIEVGKPAPPFTLPNQDGVSVSLADFRGKEVIVYFYPKNGTPGCTKEACSFRDLSDELRQQGAVVLGISPDSVESHRAFADHHQLPFTLLSDPEKKVMEAYGAWGAKVLYGKPTVGVIRSTVWVDRDGKVRHHWPKIAKAEIHPAKVLAALAAD